MTKVAFGEYSAYTTPGGIRFMKNGRLASENGLPPEVVTYLKDKLGDDSGKVAPVEAPKKFPRPSEEELARMRAESLQVKPELQMTPQEIIDRTPEDAPFVAEEFMPTSVEEADTSPSAEQMYEVASILKDSNGNEPLPRAVEPAGLHSVPVEPDFLETVSIHTADLRDIAQALYERFGIYTVYLDQLPQGDEVNPLTGITFTKYHLGIAYQAAIYAKNQGVLERQPESQRKQMDTSRATTATMDAVPTTMGENRLANTFAYRTSVRGSQDPLTTRIEHVMGEDGQLHAVQVPVTNNAGEPSNNGANIRYSHDEQELIVEPPIGGKQIIRPNW